MDPNQVRAANELLEAQAHIFRHAFNYANSMSLACALELGIPDAVHEHREPITPSRLASALGFPVEKSGHLCRLMRLLVHNGFFATERVQGSGGEENEGEEEGYVLTPSSRLLLKSEKLSLSPFVWLVVGGEFLSSWQAMGRWFRGNETTAFETANGDPLYELADKNPRFTRGFNEAMASNSQMASLVARDLEGIFGDGVESVVDVGGGRGVLAKIITEAFPRLHYTVFDLPHVVAGLESSANLKYVGGDMFRSIPSADVIVFKLVLHNWSDEDCVKMLERSREAIQRGEGKQGKVVIIDMVIDEEKDEHSVTETKLVFDLLMMVLTTGRERSEKQLEKLFFGAGFTRYKIHPIFGLRSLIEVFP